MDNDENEMKRQWWVAGLMGESQPGRPQPDTEPAPERRAPRSPMDIVKLQSRGGSHERR